MQLSQIYLFHQRHRVILLDTSGEFFSRRYNQVYTKNLKAHKGTDNRILIEFVNQDQKPVDVTGMQFILRLISTAGDSLLLQKELLIVNALKGQTNLILTEAELDRINSGTIGFSIEQVAVFNEPVYVDDNAGARGNLEIIDSILPTFVSSTEVTFPDGQDPVTFVSSLIDTDDSKDATFQIQLTDFIGDITIQGATDVDGLWYDIVTLPFPEATTALQGMGIPGVHPYLQLSITNNTAGTIDNVLYR